MVDTTLDAIKVPLVNFNIQTLVILIKDNILALGRECQSPESKEVRKHRESGDSPTLQRDEIVGGK